MKILVVYDSVSPARITEKIAQAIVEELKEGGISTELRSIEDVDRAIIMEYDCLVLGAPTMAWWRPSKGMRDFLTSLQGSNYDGKMAAAFDTQMWTNITGNSAGSMEKSLTKLGFRIISPPLVSYVGVNDRVYSLRDGEMEKAKMWGKGLSKKLLK